MDDVDREEGGVGVEEVSSVSEVGVVKVEGREVAMRGVGGVSVGGGAPVDIVGVVVSEVLLSEKQMNTHNLNHQQMKTSTHQ